MWWEWAERQREREKAVLWEVIEGEYTEVKKRSAG